jgi:hypothetical protein
VLRFLFLALHQSELRSLASAGLVSLAALDYDTRATGVSGLISRHLQPILRDITSPASASAFEEPSSPEFQLLELFTLSPWFHIQSNLSLLRELVEYLTSALSRMLSKLSSPASASSSALTIVSSEAAAPGSFSSLSSSSSSSALMEYANLLLATLAPVFSSSVPLSKHFLDLFPLSEGSREISTALCLRPHRLEGLADSLLQFLLSPSRSQWNATPSLQSARLDLLSLLLCQQLLPAGEQEEGEQQVETLAFVGQLLSAHSADLFTQVFAHTALPTSPFPLRLKSIRLLSHAIRCNSNNGAAGSKIIPYSRRTDLSSSPSSSSAMPIAVLDLLLEHLTSVCLNDASDEIRLPSLEAILLLIPFLKRQQQQVEELEHSSSTHFAGLVECLLTHCLVGNPTEEILSHLDLLLRSIAILDPVAFETLVREKFSSLSSAQRNSNVSGFFSGLIDHADVLSQFQQLSLSK